MDEHEIIEMSQEEIALEREKLLAKARLTKSQMVRLQDDNGFKEYLTQLQLQIDRRMKEILTLPTGGDDIIQRTHTIGELAGLKLAMDYPSILISYAQSSIDSARIIEENLNGQETKPDREAGRGRERTSFELIDDDGDDFEPGRGRSAP